MSDTTLTTSTTEIPSASSTPNGNTTIGNASSNLYLVTFLATLFLLLFVSCAIVLRSYILRRRYQRRLEEAMSSGLLLAPRTQGSKRKRFGTKPKLFDAWLSHTGSHWNDLMPLAAQPVFVKRKFKEPSSKPPASATTPNNPATPQTPSTPIPSSANPLNGTPNGEQPLVTSSGPASNQLDQVRPFTADELYNLERESNSRRPVRSIFDTDEQRPVGSNNTRPWRWFSRRDRRTQNPDQQRANRDGEDGDPDDEDYDMPPITTTTAINAPPSLFNASVVNRNSSPGRSGPATMTNAFLSSSSQLDPGALRAAAAAGAVPGGSMPLGIMPIAGAVGTYKVRIEMLQVTTLIAMPCPPGRDGKSRVQRIRGYKSFNKRRQGGDGKGVEEDDGTEESDGDSDDEEERMLPELVFGVARVNHKYPLNDGYKLKEF